MSSKNKYRSRNILDPLPIRIEFLKYELFLGRQSVPEKIDDDIGGLARLDRSRNILTSHDYLIRSY